MRTTLDIDLHSYRLAKAVAAQKGISLGKLVTEAILAQFGSSETAGNSVGKSAAGFPVMSIGRPITSKDVDELLDD